MKGPRPHVASLKRAKQGKLPLKVGPCPLFPWDVLSPLDSCLVFGHIGKWRRSLCAILCTLVPWQKLPPRNARPPREEGTLYPRISATARLGCRFPNHSLTRVLKGPPPRSEQNPSLCSLQGKKKRRSREKHQESNTGEASSQQWRLLSKCAIHEHLLWPRGRGRTFSHRPLGPLETRPTPHKSDPTCEEQL